MSCTIMLDQTIEERAELIVACEKLKRNITPGNPTPVTEEEALESVKEEIADIQVCLGKLTRVLGISLSEIDEIMTQKIARAEERLKDV